MFKKNIETFHETIMYSLCIVGFSIHSCAPYEKELTTRLQGMAGNRGIYGLRAYDFACA